MKSILWAVLPVPSGFISPKLFIMLIQEGATVSNQNNGRVGTVKKVHENFLTFSSCGANDGYSVEPKDRKGHLEVWTSIEVKIAKSARR